jgi:hypothetical protein
MDKATFLAVLKGIVEEFENPAFQLALEDAQTAGDVSRIMEITMEAQAKVFAANGVDPAGGATAFKAAGKLHGDDPLVPPLADRMRRALGK